MIQKKLLHVYESPFKINFGGLGGLDFLVLFS